VTSPTATIVAIASLYFAICAAIAWWAARRTRTNADFFVAGRGVGIWTLAIASMAATLSGFAFVGGPGLVYARGIGAVYIVLPAAVTGALTAWVLARRLRLLREVRGVLTIPEAVGARYRCRTARRLAAAALLVATLGYIAANFLALGLILEAVFGLERTAAIGIGAAVVIGYSATGGMLAGMYTDLFQGTVMAVTSGLVFAKVLDVGGGLAAMAQAIVAADPGWFGPWGHLTPVAALSFFFVFSFGTLGQPHVLHKFYMLRDPRQLRWYPLLMTGAMLVTVLLYVGIGMVVKAEVSAGSLAPLTTPDEATPGFVLRHAPALLAGLVMSGVAAAIMSTVNSFLNLAAAAIARDLPGRSLGDRRELAVGRIATLVVGMLGATLAAGSSSLVALLGVFGFGLFATTLVPSLALGMVWSGATRTGALASMAVGLASTLVLGSWPRLTGRGLPAGVDASGVALVLSVLVFVVVSRATRARAGSDLDPDVRLAMER
jgi:SSS family transporter